MTEYQILALDFDGVIADSIDECLVTGHNAYSRYQERYERRLDLTDFSASEIARFKRLRPLIRRGEDYVFLLQSMDEKIDLHTQKDFDEYLKSNTERRTTYRKLFHEERAALQESNPEKWLNLNPMYPGMDNFLRDQIAKKQLIIVTTKDLISVQMILGKRGIRTDSSHLFQATRTHRKPAILKEVTAARQLAPQDIVFIDDHVATVEEVSDQTDVQTFCAEWGYNTLEQVNQLKKEGIPSLSLDEFNNEFSILEKS